MSGRCFTRYSAPSSPETRSCNVLKRRARCCLDLIWAKAFFPLSPLPRPMTKNTDNRQKAMHVVYESQESQTQSAPLASATQQKNCTTHLYTPHVLGTTIKQKYCTNSREVRAKFAKNPRTVVGRAGRAFAKNCAKFARTSREVRSMFRPRCNVQGLKRAVRRVTLLACSANGAPRALGLGRRGGLEGRVSGGLHQGVPRLTLLHSVVAVQGSLIPRHHRLEG